MTSRGERILSMVLGKNADKTISHAGKNFTNMVY